MADAARSLDLSDAFAALGRLSLQDGSLASVMGTIAGLTQRTVHGTSEVSVTLVEDGRPGTLAWTGALALDLDERQYERGSGPCLDALDLGRPVRIDDMAAEDRWADWTAEARRRGVGSSLSVPVPLRRGARASLNLYSTTTRAFRDDDVEEAATFASYAGVALANMQLYLAQVRLGEDLRRAMDSHAVVDQAKGMLMSTRRCTAEQAYAVLVDVAQATDRTAREVARTLVETGSTDV